MSSSSNGSIRRTGFTLIELLVVVAIIALLIAILLPSLGKARTTAKRVACGTALKGWGTAINTYGADYNGYFTAAATIPNPPPATGTTNATWASGGIYDPYMGNLSPKMRVCPADGALPYFNSLGKECKVNYLFARYNPKRSGFNGPYKFADFKNAASKLLMTDGYWNNGAVVGNIHGGTASGGDAFVNPTGLTTGPYPPWDQEQILKDRHGGKGQVLFVDSHVDSHSWADYVANVPDQQSVAPASPAAADLGKPWLTYKTD